MSRRPPPSSSSVLPQQNQNRQNEYFVPRDGIDREVITADICRYLGNDALVRPGNYENPQTGQIIQGYYINAYRNLTTAMIEDLKADSARWEQERRHQSASRNNTAGGTIASRDSNVVFIKSSNSPAVQYRNSDTHQSRQYYGPTEITSADTSRDPYGDSTPRYPGTGTQGYTGAAGFSGAQQYANQSGYVAQAGYTTQPSQFAAQAANVSSFAPGHPMTGSGFGQAGQEPPYQVVGAHSAVRAADPYSNDSYASRDSRDPRGDPRDHRDPRVPVTTMSSSRTTYTTAGPSAGTQGYPASGSSSYYPQSSSTSNPQFGAGAQPMDAFYGRGAYTKSPLLPSNGFF
ncbi:Uu.00g109150.m01.CDS01 [Anthostomella pinea]|uniref:Uu.00g109150.m01.CDS01 n=1 Tax=Anthostomella pinea TaxID=933095 RepID=A0AAI8YDQ8_9PEZI|nr:Uu.00g109150.m01.CDS01 [Anthostomella pinea]